MKFLVCLGLAFSLGAVAADDHGGSSSGEEGFGPWKLVLPRLLTSERYRLKQICDEVEAGNAGITDPAKQRHFAIIALKSHACDCDAMQQVCLQTTRNLADPCNTFLHRNFVAYHTRPMRYGRKSDAKVFASSFDKQVCEILPDAKKVISEWGKVLENAELDPGPGLAIVDTKACKAVGKVPADRASTDEDRLKRAEQTNAAIREAFAKLPETEETKRILAKGRDFCSEADRGRFPPASLSDLYDALEGQTEKAVANDPMSILRQLSGTGTISLEPTLDHMGELFGKAGIDLKAITAPLLEKWGKGSADDMYACQEDIGAAIARAVKAKVPATDGQRQALTDISDLVARMKKVGYSKMTYSAPDLQTFQRNLAPPLFGNDSNGKYFAVASFLASQDVCLVCHGGALKRETAP